MLRSSLILSTAFVLCAAASSSAAPAGQIDPNIAKLRNPAALKQQAPPVYKAKFDTSAGVFVIEVHRDWAPNGADRFYNLVKNGFYDNVRFFRVVPGFMVQFGINGNPAVQSAWTGATIADDPVKQSNTRGMVTYAMGGPNTRTTQVFINFRDNARSLDSQGFAPFGKVISGMDVVDKLYGSYGDGPSQSNPNATGPDQQLVRKQGNKYLVANYPKLDYVKKATIEQ